MRLVCSRWISIIICLNILSPTLSLFSLSVEVCVSSQVPLSPSLEVCESSQVEIASTASASARGVYSRKQRWKLGKLRDRNPQ